MATMTTTHTQVNHHLDKKKRTYDAKEELSKKKFIPLQKKHEKPAHGTSSTRTAAH